MLPIISENDFRTVRRERLLDFTVYRKKAEDLSMRIPRTTRNLADADWMAKKNKGDAMMMSSGRARYSADLITLSFSAGVPVEHLREFYPLVLDHWDEYAAYAIAFDNSPEYEGSWVAHFALLGDSYEMVNRIVCIGILLGWTKLLPRIAHLIEYRNPKMDGLLERLLSPFVEGRPIPPDKCTRHLPYFKTLKIFKADKDARPAMMAQYLADWYEASRREPYYDSHKRSNFFGYWSWEAAAITVLLDIDDASYRDATFYPRDLVEFARKFKAQADVGQGQASSVGELRCTAGDVCPASGKWETLSLPNVSAIFHKGERIPESTTPYGLTVWVFRGESYS